MAHGVHFSFRSQASRRDGGQSRWPTADRPPIALRPPTSYSGGMDGLLAELAAMPVSTVKDFAEALKRGEDTIEIKGNLAEKVITIKATGRIAWLDRRQP